MSDVQIVMTATSGEWAARLTEWISDHGGGARLRDTYLFTRADALEQDFDCLVADADSTILEPAVVAELRRRNRAIVGVCDPDLPHTRARLEQLGVDRIVDDATGPPDMLRAVLDVTATRQRFHAVVEGLDRAAAADASEMPARPTTADGPVSCLTVVTGPAEGVGATEVAIELGIQLRHRHEAVAVVDADFVAPSLAQRLRMPLLPNLNSAVDAVAHRSGALADVLGAVAGAGFDLLAGLEHPKNWVDFGADDILDVLTLVRSLRPQVIVNIGSQLEALPSGRHDVARSLIAACDRIVAVAGPSPVGLQRLSRWLVDVDGLTDTARVHVVFNRSATGQARQQLDRELLRIGTVGGITHVPPDHRVERASWACHPVRPGPFTRALAALAATLPRTSEPVRRRRRLTGGRA